MNDTFMKEKPVLPLILSMSLPMVLSMLVNSLYNIVDSYFVAQVSQNALTAVSLAFPIQNLMIAVSTGLGVGLNAVLSRALGAKDEKGVNRAATNGIMLLFICGLIFMIGGVLPFLYIAFLGVKYFRHGRTVYSFPADVLYTELAPSQKKRSFCGRDRSSV